MKVWSKLIAVILWLSCVRCIVSEEQESSKSSVLVEVLVKVLRDLLLAFFGFLVRGQSLLM